MNTDTTFEQIIYNRLSYKHLTECRCDPCAFIRQVRDVPKRALWGRAGQCPREHSDDKTDG